ncbi:GreA/GreB family elongation factor [Mangrovimonas sp. AS39]|uniref:GreA/GreB family elongation factor n=1 Tax=Mangrovimonas futianensis TaxID=2895523 RepID=UPI001E5DF507|nr:GreA/GreB family elongation factor [Mangrovimonas futianensis]MCF1192269.1 GreA/GreB family elongation factor [Mangrovimonas futianensis]MCF1195982.1 GreA/GreB family elongation factor [Mangrovimonas futianensis]
MKYGSLILEKKEYVYLKRILNITGYSSNDQTQKSIEKLLDELKTAHIVDEEEMPEDVIRFNSKVTVVSDTGWEKTMQVVIPSDRDVTQNKISVLMPMGAALFGYSNNDTLEWDFPGGKQQLKITSVTQEETLSGIDLVI